MTATIEEFQRHIDNVAVHINGKEWFVRADMWLTLRKTVYSGDWITPDDYEVEIEDTKVMQLTLLDPDTPDLKERYIVVNCVKRHGNDDINLDDLISDMLCNDDSIIGWMHDRAREMYP